MLLVYGEKNKLQCFLIFLRTRILFDFILHKTVIINVLSCYTVSFLSIVIRVLIFLKGILRQNKKSNNVLHYNSNINFKKYNINKIFVCLIGFFWAILILYLIIITLQTNADKMRFVYFFL